MIDTLKQRTDSVPISERFCLTVEEASGYFGIGQKKIKEISQDDSCPFVLWVGNKRLIKRKELEAYLSKQFSI